MARKTTTKAGLQPADTVITIPAIQLRRMTVTIEGITPLVTNRFREAALEDIERKQQGKARQAKAPRDPEVEFRGALHVINRNSYGFPATGIVKALVAAGGRFADGTMTILRGVLSIPADLVPIRGSEPEMRRDFVMLNGGKGPASVAYRPMFRKWEMDVPVVYMENMITDEQILNLFQLAGFSVGIGAWRRECKGTFGQFQIKGIVENGKRDGDK